jgi:hypothetical protein
MFAKAKDFYKYLIKEDKKVVKKTADDLRIQKDKF